MSEKFTAEDLKRMAGPNDNGKGGFSIHCPFCTRITLHFVGTMSLGIGEEEETNEFRCSMCNFGGYEEYLLIGTTKKEQVMIYRDELVKKSQNLIRDLINVQKRIALYGP